MSRTSSFVPPKSVDSEEESKSQVYLHITSVYFQHAFIVLKEIWSGRKHQKQFTFCCLHSSRIRRFLIESKSNHYSLLPFDRITKSHWVHYFKQDVPNFFILNSSPINVVYNRCRSNHCTINQIEHLYFYFYYTNIIRNKSFKTNWGSDDR